MTAAVPEITPCLTTRELMACLRETLLVLRERDGVALTDAQIDEGSTTGS